MNSTVPPATVINEPVSDTIARDMRVIVTMLLHAGTKSVNLDSALLFWDMDPEETAQRIWWELATHYGIGAKARVVQVADAFEPAIRIRMMGDIADERADYWDAPLLCQSLLYRRHAERHSAHTGVWCGSSLEPRAADSTQTSSCISCQRPL